MENDAIEQLEIKIAFLENATSELSDVVFKQQQDIATLNDRLAVLSSRFDTLKSDRAYTAEEERPPHY
jgi:uncharacterized coiled-coil protein SlyX